MNNNLMNEIVMTGFDNSIVEQSSGTSILEALLVLGMVVFLVWSVKLSAEEVK